MKKKNNVMLKRFSYYSNLDELLLSYKHWIEESYRVLKDDGILVFKCQNVITSSKFLCTEYYSKLIADSIGFDIKDEFILLAKNRLISGKIKEQKHARSFHSYFLIFKKSSKTKVKYFTYGNEEIILTILNGIKKNNTKNS